MRFSKDKPGITCGASAWFFHININTIIIIIAGMPKIAASKNEFLHRRVSRRWILNELDALESSLINEAGNPID